MSDIIGFPLTFNASFASYLIDAIDLLLAMDATKSPQLKWQQSDSYKCQSSLKVMEMDFA